MKKPNFFLIGAPKCGTTSMCSYLGQHPQIFISAYKEPKFFSQDIPRVHQFRDLREYEALFQDADERHAVVGEGSTSYMQSKEAARLIREYSPEAKILAMIRDPMTMLPSYHSQMLRSAEEDQRDFAVAWSLEPMRRLGKSLPVICKQPLTLYYSDCAKYGEQLERFYALFPKEHIKVILFEDLAAGPSAVYQEVLGFLEVNKSFQPDIEKLNPSQRVKFLGLNALTERPPRWAVNLAMRFKYMLGLERLNILDRLKSLNRRQVTRRASMSKKLQRQIVETYAADVAKLEKIVQRDLSHWLNLD